MSVTLGEGPIPLFPRPAHPNNPCAVYRPIHTVPLEEGRITTLTFTSIPTMPPRRVPAHRLGASPRGAIPLLLSTGTSITHHAVYRRTHLVPLMKVPYHSFLHQYTKNTHNTPSSSTGVPIRGLSKRDYTTPNLHQETHYTPRCLPEHTLGASRGGVHTTPNLHQHTHTTPRCLSAHSLGVSQGGGC